MAVQVSAGISRRAWIKRGTLVTGAIVTSTLPVTRSFAAQTPVQSIKADEYSVSDGDVRLYIYRKRLVGGTAKPVLFLAHGSSVSSVPTFDLHVPGHGEYSMMDVFARHGFDVWTMDFEGYGKSSRSGGNSDIARGVHDILLALPLIQKESGQQKIHMFGESSGALRVGLFAQNYPEKVARLALASLSYTGEGSPTLAKRKESLPFLSTHDRRPRDREMILSIFTRDAPGTYDPATPDALADMELKLPGSETVPTGSYVDMTTKLPLLDPLKAVQPLLLLRGEHDGIATESDVLSYFSKAATKDKELRIIPDATHALGWGNQRAIAWEALRSFLKVT